MRTRAPSSTSSSSRPAHLIVGRLGRAVGLKGEIELRILSDAPDRFAPGAIVLKGDDHLALTVSRVRTHGDRTIVTFEEVGDRNGAEELNGAELVIEAAQARALEPGEFWDHDLLGCRVETTDGDALGEVTDVLHTAPNDILVVQEGEREHLIPLISDIVVSVEAGRIEIVALPGLLDDRG